MNVAYSSVVRETITENGTTHSRLVSVFENHVKQHGASPSLPQLFDSAREEASSDHDRAVITWLESAVIASDSQGGSHILKHHHNHDDHQAGGGVFVSPMIFPSEESYGHLLSTLSSAKKTLDICVFTITDDQITRAIIQMIAKACLLSLEGQRPRALSRHIAVVVLLSPFRRVRGTPAERARRPMMA